MTSTVSIFGIIFFVYYCLFIPSVTIFGIIRRFGATVVFETILKFIMSIFITIGKISKEIYKEIQKRIEEYGERRRSEGYIRTTSGVEISLDDFDLESNTTAPYLNNSGELTIPIPDDDLEY